MKETRRALTGGWASDVAVAVLPAVAPALRRTTNSLHPDAPRQEQVRRLLMIAAPSAVGGCARGTFAPCDLAAGGAGPVGNYEDAATAEV